MKQITPVQPGTDQKTITASEISRILENDIRNGTHPEGSRLPTVRELARELGVSKNTVVRAYQNLEKKGYLQLVRGRGAFVRQREPARTMDEGQWIAQMEQLLKDARQQGLKREVVLRRVLGSIDRILGKESLRVAFVECNYQEIASLGNDLSNAVGHTMEGVLLSDLVDEPEATAAQFDLVVTTFYHLGEVNKVLSQLGQEKVVGVHAMPAHDALLNIARLHEPVIGLVCELSSTINSLSHIIQTYHPQATVLPSLFNDNLRLETVLAKADVLVVTRSCHERLMDFQPQAPVITVSFTIDQQSIDFLRNRIQELTCLPTIAPATGAQ
ncbi:MAG: GntR family transcriptional regulator [Chloroflexi bacterium]|nr:GntR family transcriptional regulator [Chloroflexota bacterium]